MHRCGLVVKLLTRLQQLCASNALFATLSGNLALEIWRWMHLDSKDMYLAHDKIDQEDT